MRVKTYTTRGTGREDVWGGGTVVARHHSPNGGHISIWSEDGFTVYLNDGDDKPALVSMSPAEISTIVQFLRGNGIEVDPERERQRKLADDLVKSFGPALPAAPMTTWDEFGKTL